jgi:toxin ParE1/3/4
LPERVEWGGRAGALLQEIHARCALLLRYPEAGRERGELWSGLRSLAASSHVVFYEVTAETIDIVRVLHGARDAESELRGGILE